MNCSLADIMTIDPELAEFLDRGIFKACPGCHEAYEKISGCNHIICRCGEHFCFLCSNKIDRRDPYSHFIISGPCYNGTYV